MRVERGKVHGRPTELEPFKTLFLCRPYRARLARSLEPHTEQLQRMIEAAAASESRLFRAALVRFIARLQVIIILLINSFHTRFSQALQKRLASQLD